MRNLIFHAIFLLKKGFKLDLSIEKIYTFKIFINREAGREKFEVRAKSDHFSNRGFFLFLLLSQLSNRLNQKLPPDIPHTAKI